MEAGEWEKQRERERGYMRKYLAKLTPERKAELRQLAAERRRTPEYRKYARDFKRKARATPEGKIKGRAELLRKKYGLTPEQWEGLFINQGSCCAICKSPEPGSKKGWHTDHCHRTDKIRGILCPPCNKALGLFKEKLASLQAAFEYLKIHNGE